MKGAWFTFDLAIKLGVSPGRASEAADGGCFVSVVSSRTRIFNSILAVVARLAWGEHGSSVGSVCSVEIRSESGDDFAVVAGHPRRVWALELLTASAITLCWAIQTVVLEFVFSRFAWFACCSPK